MIEIPAFSFGSVKKDWRGEEEEGTSWSDLRVLEDQVVGMSRLRSEFCVREMGSKKFDKGSNKEEDSGGAADADGGTGGGLIMLRKDGVNEEMESAARESYSSSPLDDWRLPLWFPESISTTTTTVLSYLSISLLRKKVEFK